MAVVACTSDHGGTDAGHDARHDGAPPDAVGQVAPPGTVGLYEAEAMMQLGGATTVGSADASDRAIGDLGGEASGRQAVTLAAASDGVSFAVLPVHGGANALVLRYSLPDAPTGGGTAGALVVEVTEPDGSTFAQTLALTSRYAWLYGGPAASTKLYNTPANAQAYAGSTAPTHLYDELPVRLPRALAAGATVRVGLPAGATVPVTVDFVELEVVGPAGTAPAGFLSLVGDCGAIPLDPRASGTVFDGADDSTYASTFEATIGTNPFNPTSGSGVQSAGTQEKDTYRNGPDDLLQDNIASPATANLGMFALADHNFASLQRCVAAVAAGSGAGVWIPPGRFYARGALQLPSHVAVRGAGRWYSKLAAVDTAPPMPVTNPANGRSGIASRSGALRLTSGSGGATGVELADFAMFGNSTQRDVVDNPSPVGVFGEFVDSTFARLWMEHYSQAVVMTGSSSGDHLEDVRARDTFADGIDFFGDTRDSSIQRSQARGTGDDGFAIWSQGSDRASSGNSLMHAEASLQWLGDNFAVYGGSNATLSDLVGTDTLTGAGLKLATEFVTPTLPASFAMSGIRVSHVTLHRCGGTSPRTAFGAVLIGAELEDIAGIVLDDITIADPSNAAVDVRLLSAIGAIATRGKVEGVALSNARISGAETCMSIGSGETGSAAFEDVCACPAASACTAVNLSPGSFGFSAGPCMPATCAP